MIGVLVASANLINGSVQYSIQKGNTLDYVVLKNSRGTVRVETCEVLGFSLENKKSGAKFGKILDGIPVNQYNTDDMANARNAEDFFAVQSIIVKVDEKIRALPVAFIQEIGGSFTAPDGSVTESVDLSNPETSVATTVTEAADNTTIVMGEGEIADEIAPTASITLAGVNAGIPQNFKQEV